MPEPAAWASTPVSAQISTGIEEVPSFYFSQGVLGVSCIVLGVVIIMLWRHVLKLQLDHKADTDAKDKLILDLQEDRLKEAIAAQQAIHKAQSTRTIEDFLDMMRSRP